MNSTFVTFTVPPPALVTVKSVSSLGWPGRMIVHDALVGASVAMAAMPLLDEALDAPPLPPLPPPPDATELDDWTVDAAEASVSLSPPQATAAKKHKAMLGTIARGETRTIDGSYKFGPRSATPAAGGAAPTWGWKADGDPRGGPKTGTIQGRTATLDAEGTTLTLSGETGCGADTLVTLTVTSYVCE